MEGNATEQFQIQYRDTRTTRKRVSKGNAVKGAALGQPRRARRVTGTPIRGNPKRRAETHAV